MRTRVFGLLVGLLMVGAANGMAQVAWDSPLLVPPVAQRGFDIFLIDPAAGDVGVLGVWRSGSRPQNLGFRVGLSEDWAGEVGVFGGADVSGVLARASRDLPLDISWVAGAGIGIGENILASFPFGLSAGHTFTGDGVTITPYLLPRVVLDALFYEDALGNNESELEMDFTADLGIDVAFRPTWRIRFGATFGDREALAIGLSF